MHIRVSPGLAHSLTMESMLKPANNFSKKFPRILGSQDHGISVDSSRKDIFTLCLKKRSSNTNWAYTLSPELWQAQGLGLLRGRGPQEEEVCN